MHVVDAVGELERELGRVEVLVCEMGRVEVDAERGASADGGERLLRRHEVVRDLRRVHLQAEADALGVEDVEDRRPRLGERLVAVLDLREVVRRERVQEVPDRRAREAVHLRDAEPCGRPCGVLHPLGSATPHAFLLAVAPHVGRQDRLMPRVDAIAHGLADEVRAERPAPEAVPLKESFCSRQ